MTKYSITIRPYKETFDKIIQKKLEVFNFLQKGCNNYVISYEKGKEDYYNHLQCYFDYIKDRRQEVVKKSILRKLFNIGIELDENERKIGVVVKTINKNHEGVIGYTLKEKGICITNFNEEEKKKYLKIYENHKEKNDIDKKNFYRTNPKNYHIYIRNFINDNEEFRRDKYRNEDIKNIIGEMINRSYYMTFLNSRNIIEKILYVKSFLNEEGRDYIDYIYEKNERFE